MEQTINNTNMNNWVCLDDICFAFITSLDHIEEEPFYILNGVYQQNNNYHVKMIHKKDNMISELFFNEPIINRENALKNGFSNQLSCNVYSHPVNIISLLPNFKGYKYKTNSILSIENSSYLIERYIQHIKNNFENNSITDRKIFRKGSNN